MWLAGLAFGWRLAGVARSCHLRLRRVLKAASNDVDPLNERWMKEHGGFDSVSDQQPMSDAQPFKHGHGCQRRSSCVKLAAGDCQAADVARFKLMR